MDRKEQLFSLASVSHWVLKTAGKQQNDKETSVRGAVLIKENSNPTVLALILEQNLKKRKQEV